MIRRAIIVVLTLAALGTGILIAGDFRLGPKGPALHYLYADGRSVYCGNGVSVRPGWVGYCKTQQIGPSQSPPWIGNIDIVPFLRVSVQVHDLATRSVAVWKVHVDLWWICVLFGVYPAAVFNCWRCGYDLTGNESGVCPECGTRIESP